jgi:uncharacterized membrane protein
MWVNHHHLLHAARHADARLMWMNNNLLFWMSLVPFVTAYMGNNYRDPRAVALYAFVLTLCSLAFTLLRGCIAHHHHESSEMYRYHHRMQRKNLFSLLLYALGIRLAFIDVRIAYGIFVFVALSYFIPERKLAEAGSHESEK